MYFVVNVTRPPRPIKLGDLGYTLGPNKAVDLEKQCSRASIERSSDLKKAIRSKQIDVRHRSSAPAPPPEPEQPQESSNPSGLSDEELKKIRQAVKEEVAQNQQQQPQSQAELMQVLQRLTSALEGGGVNQVPAQASQPTQGGSDDDDLDEDTLAAVHAKAVGRQSKKSQASGKIDYSEKETDDISSHADELDQLLS